jgi:hypothetical protein
MAIAGKRLEYISWTARRAWDPFLLGRELRAELGLGLGLGLLQDPAVNILVQSKN